MEERMRKSPYVLVITLTIAWVNCLSVAFAGNANDSSNQIIIDVSKGRTVAPFLGNNLQAHDWTLNYPDKNYTKRWENTKYGAGIWNPVKHQPVAKLVNIAKQLNTASLRFPGGNGASHYDWKKAIGPISERNKGYHFGPDEFLQITEQINAMPIITLSYFNWDNRYQADFIEYLAAEQGTNPNGGTAWAKFRAANGHPKPYPIKYVEFGNEVYLGDFVDENIIDPRGYARRYLEVRELIKNINPKIQVGAVLKNSLEYQLSSWDLDVIGVIKGELDFAIMHFYPMSYRSNKNKLKAEELFKIALAAPEQIKINLESYALQLKNLTGKEIPLAITEFNGGMIQSKPVPYRHTLGNALLNFELMRIMAESKSRIISANYWQFVDRFWGAVYNPNYLSELDKGIEGNYLKRPNFYALEIFGKYFTGQLLETRIKSESYTSAGYANVHGTYQLKDRFKHVQKSVKMKQRAEKQLFKAKHWKNYYDPFGASTQKKTKEIIVRFKGNKDPNYYHASLNRIDIKPDHQYRLTAKMKVDNITSSEGVYLEIQDQRGWKETQWAKGTKELFQTNGWIDVSTDFVPLSDSKEIKIHIRRKSGGGVISGVARVKDVVIENLGPAIKYPATQYLTALASMDKKQNKVYLIVVNKHLKKTLEAKIALKNFDPNMHILTHVLNAPNIDSTNENKVKRVVIKDKKQVIEISKGFFNFQFEPHSITAIEFLSASTH